MGQRDGARLRLVEKKLRSEDLHHVIHHFLHVQRFDDFPIQMIQLLHFLMIRIIDLTKERVLIHQFHSIQLNSRLNFTASLIFEILVQRLCEGCFT